MKKKISVLLVTIMALVMALPVMAAPSPAAKGVVTEVKQSVDKSGEEVNVIVREKEVLFEEIDEETKEDYVKAVEKVASEDKEASKEAVKKAIEKVFDSEEKVEELLESFETEYEDLEDLVEKIEVIDVKDVHVSDKSKVEWPLTITFKVPGVVKESTVTVLHFNGIDWEAVPSKIIADGEVEATFESLSPVAFVVDKTTLVDAKEEVIEEEKEDAKEETPVEEVVEEPVKESSNTMIYVIVVIAVIAVVAVIFSKKKNK